MTDDELRRLFESLRQENASAHEETRKYVDASAAETRREFHVVAEQQDKKIQFLAEAIATVDEKLERRIDGLEAEMKREFADTRSMIKFSHSELDRRPDLQSRVERLESSTH